LHKNKHFWKQNNKLIFRLASEDQKDPEFFLAKNNNDSFGTNAITIVLSKNLQKISKMNTAGFTNRTNLQRLKVRFQAQL
jgi:CRISPR/Cas system-associated endonuclease Cas1